MPGLLKKKLGFVLCAVFILFTTQACAFEVLPERQKVRIKLVSDNKALVEEERYLKLRQGLNQIYLDYRGARVVPGSLNIQFVQEPQKIELIQTMKDLREPSSFGWRVYSEKEGTELVRVSYLLNGLMAEYSYTARTDKEEDKISLEGWVNLVNQTGEEFLDAHLKGQYRGEWSISLRDEQRKKLYLFEAVSVPLEKVYLLEQQKYGEKVVLQYQFTNLTGAPLPPGRVEIYQEDNHKLTFLGESIVGFLNVGEKVKIPVSSVQNIKCERKLVDFSRINIRRDEAGNIEVYDTREKYQIYLKNQKDEKVKLLVREYIPDTWEMITSDPVDYTREDAHHIEFEVVLSSGQENIISYELSRLNLLPGEPVRPLTE